MSDTIVSKSTARNLSVDLWSAEDVQNVHAETGGRIASRNVDSTLDKYLLTVTAQRMTAGAMTAGNAAAAAGLAPGTFSKIATLGKVFDYIANGGDHDAKVVAMAGEMATFWDFDRNGTDRPSLSYVAMALTADDGAKRSDAIVALYGAYGATEYAYHVAKGNRFHADDPRSAESDEDQDDQDTDGADSDGEIAWQVKLAEAVDRAIRQGADKTAISAEFMAILAR